MESLSMSFAVVIHTFAFRVAFIYWDHHKAVLWYNSFLTPHDTQVAGIRAVFHTSLVYFLYILVPELMPERHPIMSFVISLISLATVSWQPTSSPKWRLPFCGICNSYTRNLPCYLGAQCLYHAAFICDYLLVWYGI